MQPRDMSTHGFSRTMQYYRSTKFLDSRQWLRNKMRCQVYKGIFPMCKGVREWERRDKEREKVKREDGLDRGLGQAGPEPGRNWRENAYAAGASASISGQLDHPRWA